MSIFEKFEMFQALMLFPAMTVIPVTRFKVGVRSLKDIYIYPPVPLMAAIGYNLTPYHALTIYGGVVVAASYLQRGDWWKDFRKGKLRHTRSLGESPIEYLIKYLPAPVAAWLIADNKVARWIDPIILMIVGIGIAHFNPVFGAWIAFAALSLRIFEEFRWGKSLDTVMDILDNALEGRNNKEVMQYIQRSDKPGTPPQPPIPVKSVLDDMADHVERMKREAEARRELDRRAAIAREQAAQEEAKQHAASAATPPPPPQVVKETIIIATAETKETVHEKETLIVERETVQPVIVAVSMPPQIEAAPTSPALTNGTHPAELTQEAVPLALPAPPKELPAPQEDGAEATE